MIPRFHNLCPNAEICVQIIGEEMHITVTSDKHAFEKMFCEELSRRRLQPLESMCRQNPAKSMAESGGDDGKGANI